jgi:hypothetical protein
MMEEVMLPGYITNWGVFKVSVRTAFSDSDHVVMACLKIKDVKQGKESVDDYIVRFEEYKSLTGFDDAALAEIFKEPMSGTSHQGAQQVSSSSTPPQVKKESNDERLARACHGKCYKCGGEGYWA